MTEDLIYDGECPVCGEEYTDGWTFTKANEGESIEGVKICIVDHPDKVLMHLKG